MALFGIKLPKIKPLKILGKGVQLLAPVALAVVDPAAGIVGALAGVAGKGTKILGKGVEAKNGNRPHKVASPLAVLGLPAGLDSIMGESVTFDGLLALLNSLGLEGVPPWLAIAFWMWLTHQIGNNIESAGKR